MSDFVTEHGSDLIVIQTINQGGIHADTAVWHRPGIHVLGLIDLIIQCLPADLCGESLPNDGHAAVILVSNGVFLIHLPAALIGGCNDFLIGTERLHIGAACERCGRGEKCEEDLFLHIFTR